MKSMPGDGVADNGQRLAYDHREIELNTADRTTINNYRLLISGIAPRPIDFISTVDSKC
jgi:hypothetical protein